MPSIVIKALVLVAVWIALAQPALARDQIRIVGSGTVYPYAAIAAEEFGQGGKFKTPIVESTGTGGGFKLFCSGTGEDKPDINDASRRITDSEKETCRKNGVTDIAEIVIGYDGIILGSKQGTQSLNLSKKQIFMALARELPDKDGKMLPNRFQSWDEIDPTLPHRPIKIYGPGTVSGTRDAFSELVMEKACQQFPAFTKAYPDDKERKKLCGTIREDGKYIESGEDYNITVQKLGADDTAMGIFGYGFYEQNPSKIKAAAIEGVAPTVDAIVSGTYGISRELYVYVKKQHIGIIPGIPEFIHELVSEHAIGPDGYVTDKGLIPLTDTDRMTTRKAAARLAPK